MVYVQAPLEITTPPKRYKPIGHCIYCPAYPSKPTNEHIIPFGIAANSLVLPRASCPDCQRKTHEADTACLRRMWWPFRTRLGAPSRGKDKPESFTLRRGQATYTADSVAISDVQESTVAPKDFPMTYSALRLPQPAVLVGRDPAAQVDYGFWMRTETGVTRTYKKGRRVSQTARPRLLRWRK
jgi:hypothetical protein